RLKELRITKERITRQLDDTTNALDPGRAVLTAALDLLDHPHDLYDTATDQARTLLNKAIFTRLYLDTDTDRRTEVTLDDLNEPYASLVDATRSTNPDKPPHQARKPADDVRNTPRTKLGGLLATALAGRCASKAAMVEVAGIEPASASVDPGLLRAQPATAFLSPGDRTGTPPSRAQSL
ncbi:MAG: site-specific recombinase, partial [Actinomycetota bacterium]|nr:site-specific recombinase [Actinomycetota bacterium]